MVYGGALVLILLVAPHGLIGTPWWRFKSARNPDARRGTAGAASPSGKPAAAGERA
jgi:hypothetical protein